MLSRTTFTEYFWFSALCVVYDQMKHLLSNQWTQPVFIITYEINILWRNKNDIKNRWTPSPIYKVLIKSNDQLFRDSRDQIITK